MDDDEGNDVLPNYDMYKAEGDLHLKKGLLAKAVDNYTKVFDMSVLQPYCSVRLSPPVLCIAGGR